MVKGKWFPQGADIAAPLSLRKSVFARERDALDDIAQQVVVYREDTPVGAARLWWEAGAFHLGDVGVLTDCRGKGYGDLLVRLALFKALTHNASIIRLTTPENAFHFFSRYGFVPEHSLQGGETHIEMLLRAEDASLGSCGSADGCSGCGGCANR